MAPTLITQAAESRKGKRKRTEADDDAPALAAPPSADEVAFRQKVLVLSSRGVDYRQRHLLSDLTALIPHAKKDAKLDSKHQLWTLNELADLSACNNALFFEARRRHDLYMWVSKTPNGPSARFHLLNAHTMDELKMTGNSLKGSRPIVCFDKAFDSAPHWQVIKELLTHVFAVPKTARKAKPFVDHVTSFSIADGKIWFRNYQILENLPAAATAEKDVAEALEAANAAAEAAGSAHKKPKKDKAERKKLEKTEGPKLSLSEIGPRFVLVPVKIFEGSFSGATVYENQEWVSPTTISAARKRERADKYRARRDHDEEMQTRRTRIEEERPEDELAPRHVFA